jgi:hypothetical protein
MGTEQLREFAWRSDVLGNSGLIGSSNPDRLKKFRKVVERENEEVRKTEAEERAKQSSAAATISVAAAPPVTTAAAAATNTTG